MFVKLVRTTNLWSNSDNSVCIELNFYICICLLRSIISRNFLQTLLFMDNIRSLRKVLATFDASRASTSKSHIYSNATLETLKGLMKWYLTYRVMIVLLQMRWAKIMYCQWSICFSAWFILSAIKNETVALPINLQWKYPTKVLSSWNEEASENFN